MTNCPHPTARLDFQWKVGFEDRFQRFGVPEGKSEVSYLSQFHLLNATGKGLVEPQSKRRNLRVSLDVMSPG